MLSCGLIKKYIWFLDSVRNKKKKLVVLRTTNVTILGGPQQFLLVRQNINPA